MLNFAERKNWNSTQILDQIREIRKELNTGEIGNLI